MAYPKKYGKPNMTNLPNEFGIGIFEQILNTPKPDYMKIQEESMRLERKMVVAMAEELKNEAKEHGDSTLLQWLHLLNAETEADLIAAEEMADRTNVPEIKEAVARIRALSADEKARDIANRRELALQEKAAWEKKMKEAKDRVEKAKKEIAVMENEKAKAEKEIAVLERERAESEKKNAVLFAELEEFIHRS